MICSGPTFGNEYGKILHFLILSRLISSQSTASYLRRDWSQPRKLGRFAAYDPICSGCDHSAAEMRSGEMRWEIWTVSVGPLSLYVTATEYCSVYRMSMFVYSGHLYTTLSWRRPSRPTPPVMPMARYTKTDDQCDQFEFEFEFELATVVVVGDCWRHFRRSSSWHGEIFKSLEISKNCKGKYPHSWIYRDFRKNGIFCGIILKFHRTSFLLV